MSQYATWAKALKVIPKFDEVELADLDPDSVVDWVRQFIDSELLGRYVVPFATTGAGANEEADETTVRFIALNLTAGLALQLRHTEDTPGGEPDNWWWKQGRAKLFRVKAGKDDLDPAHATLDTTGTYQGRRIKAKRMDWPPTFNKGNELDWSKPVIEPDGDREQLDPDEYKAEY